MNITDVRIRLVNNDEKLKAVASITIDNEFVIHELKVINGKEGFFLSMPRRKVNEGEFKDIVHPIKTETRVALTNLILEEYQKALANAENQQ